jgi:hypothetical protein
MSKEKPICQYTISWMKAKHGKACLAPFTGQDHSVFTAYCHLLQAWFRSDYPGRENLLIAMRETLQACQPCVLPFAKDAIICIGDYGFVDQIWPEIVPLEPLTKKAQEFKNAHG